jgi:hypothetical protein
MDNHQKLAPEIVSLVHHIELNKAGWWDLAVQRLILTVFWIKKDLISLTPSAVKVALENDFNIKLDESIIQKQINTLEASGQILSLPDGHFKPSEHTIRNCEKEILEAEELETLVKKKFQELLAQHCPGLDHIQAWTKFSENFLLPLVKELGANTYRLISGADVKVEFPQLKYFSDCFDASETVGLQNFVRSFLDPADSKIRRYILRTMNACFVVQASGLNEKTIEKLTRSAEPPSMVLFFDTNVLFSLLGLHENPADEGSLALLSLVQQLSKSFPIKLRVLPLTLDEMKMAITASQEAVISLRVSSELLDTAFQAGITGITGKYLRLSASRSSSVSPAEYYQPYLKNLLTILRGHGVDLFSQELTGYKKDQAVIDDLMTQLEFEKNHFGDKAKNYERLEHDMILWHFVKRKRPIRAESPLDAEYWIVTVDYRLLAFDSFKQRQIHSDVPLCLHPTTLVQLLQFWVPQSPALEEAILSTMRLPTVFTLLDSDTERISLRILNALSTFENIGNLPKETAIRILLNDALRQKMKLEEDISRQVELVREALIEENKKTEQRLAEIKARTQQLQQDTVSLQNQISLANAKVDGLQRELADQREATIRNKTEALDTRQKLEKMIDDSRRSNARRRFMVWNFVVFALMAATITYLAYNTNIQLSWIKIIVALVIFSWIWVIEKIGKRNTAIRDWRFAQAVFRFKTWIFGSLLVGILGSAGWDGIKYLYSGKIQNSNPTQIKLQQKK